MKRFAKTLGVTCAAAFALVAMTAVSASAATFTASATGTLTGTSSTNQVFTTGGGGTVTCTHAHTHGTIVSTAAASQHVTVTYTNCTAFGFAATVSPATYELYANGEVDVENTITISVFGCTTTVKPQKGLKSVSYTNSAGQIIQHSAVKNIVSTASGFPCSGGTTGTYTGSNVIQRVGGGTLTYDP
jgi:hypothetical protein